MNLHQLFIKSCQNNPQALALSDYLGCISYADLEKIIRLMVQTFHDLGIGPGDKVGLFLPKSRYAVAVMQAALRLGAAYVPLDPQSPLERIHIIIKDCQLNLLITQDSLIKNFSFGDLKIVLIHDELEKNSWYAINLNEQSLISRDYNDDELAYILYTSGSTGIPKGICISHQNAYAFIKWSVETIKPCQKDRFANHAPFHFDLSVFDLYVSFYVGASVYLIPESKAYLADSLINFINHYQISIWYSVPSVLLLIMQKYDFLNNKNLSLRIIIFAGEVFPIKQFYKLQQAYPGINYFNFYGPTETNVCMYYQCNFLPKNMHSIPIGMPACNSKFYIKNHANYQSNIGELIIQGPTVMKGYWGDNISIKKDIFSTGDLVKVLPNGLLEYLGRIDNQIKIRGHRIELEEIEKILMKHDFIEQAAVKVEGHGLESKLISYVVSSSNQLTLINVKAHCAKYLPRYMIIDALRVVSELPLNSNGKLNRSAL
ncbi:amino acid adenylation domain-containing protein [Legionella septentrionalis]|uniref:amino acid adenylation domain-containing protein n=1 Tax=Legionella septentrionalis TaxID=2498109 RepID=UPI000F8F69F6|nr:amino acid adenylation domain-containing protein [Legionella septentrionalis]RUQ94627.1 D-alanine--poly(phosphoribitol) ligase [Legionella septentrionalis]